MARNGLKNRGRVELRRVRRAVRLGWRTGVLTLLLSTPACAPADPAPSKPPPGYPNAYAMRDCAPWDGPATTIYLSPNEATPGALGSEVAPPLVWVSVYQPLEALAGERFTVDQRSTAGAMRCPAPGVCEPASTGWVRFRASPGPGAVGEVFLEFVGDTIAGSFEAAWLDRQVLCG